MAFDLSLWDEHRIIGAKQRDRNNKENHNGAVLSRNRHEGGCCTSMHQLQSNREGSKAREKNTRREEKRERKNEGDGIHLA